MSSRAVILVMFLVMFIWPSVEAALTIQESNIDLGSDSTEKFATNGSRVMLSKTITLQASDKGYDNLEWSFVGENGVEASDITVSLPSNNTINKSASVALTVELLIPDDFSAVNDNLEKTRFDIGTITISGDEVYDNHTLTGNTGTDTIDLTLQIANKLSLNKIELKKEDADSIIDVTSSSVIEVNGGQDIEFSFFITNTFGNSTGVSFSTIDLKMNIEDYEDDDAKIFDVNPGETEKESFEFGMDNEAAYYDVVIEIEGVDEYGGKHGLVKEFNLDVNVVAEEEEAVDDQDADGRKDDSDNCPYTFNPNQEDKDGDGIGDACDLKDSSQEDSQDDELQQQTQQNKDQEKPKEDVDNETNKKEKESDGSHYFMPFLVGFVVGAIMATGFFFLLRN